MPRHAFSFPEHVRHAVKRHVEKALAMTDITRFRQEDPFAIGLASQLQGVAYDDDDARVEFRATVVDEKGRGAAQGWSGADLVITAEISDPRQAVRNTRA